jgi:hypothetical protein
MATTHGSASNFLGSVISESTSGTDPSSGGAPSSFDQFRKLEIVPKYVSIERERGTYHATSEGSHMVPSHCEVSGEIPLLPNANGESAPGSPILLAGGMAETVNDSTDVRYAVQTLDNMATTPSATFLKYILSANDDEAKRFMSRGTKLSNIAINLEVGAEAFIGFQGIGLFDAAPTSFSSAPTAPTAYGADLSAYRVATMAVTFGGTTYDVKKVILATNFNLERDDSGEDGGVGMLAGLTRGRPITGSAAGGSMDLEGGVTALNDVYTKSPARTRGALDVTLSNGTRTVKLVSAAIELGDPGFSGGVVRKASVPITCVRAASSAGGADFELVFVDA